MSDTDDFLVEVKTRNLKGMEMGVEHGWWPSFDDRGPHPWPFTFSPEDNELWHSTTENMNPDGKTGWEIKVECDNRNIWFKKLDNVKFMSQLLFEMKAFDSIGDARKAGWNRPIVAGDFWFKKKTVRLIVSNSDE